MLIYYRGRWPDDVIPDGAPEWLLYEVDTENDAVLRLVEIFPDGRKERNNLELEARDGFPCISVCHGPFMEFIDGAGLEIMPSLDFEAHYAESIDKPFASQRR